MDRRQRAPAAAPGDPQSRVGRSSECGHLKWAHFSHYLHEFWLHLGGVFAVGWRCVVTNVGPTPESYLHVSVVGDVKVGQVGSGGFTSGAISRTSGATGVLSLCRFGSWPNATRSTGARCARR